MKYIVNDKDYLIHHGVTGQKWGVVNGPPYPLNDTVKAIAYRGGVLKDGTQLNINRRDVQKARKIVNKNIKYLSTNELNEYRNRLMLEGNIGDITGSNWAQKQGKKILDSLERIGSQSAVNIGTQLATRGGLLAITKILENRHVSKDNISYLTNFKYDKKKEDEDFGDFYDIPKDQTWEVKENLISNFLDFKKN